MSNERQDSHSPDEYADSFTGLSKASTEPTVQMQQRNGGYSGYEPQDATLVTTREQAVTVASDDPFIGRTIGDHYQILSKLGSGGMSVVYKARHTLLHRNMAVKFLLPQSDLDSKTLSRFQQEAKAAFTLNHLNIARVNELGIDGGEMPYIVMDYVEGPTLGELIEQNGPLPVNRVVDIIGQACSGLEHAHAKDIIHRDIKPGNLILTREGDKNDLLKIVDFGIAKILHEAEGTQHLTQTGEVFGSPLYMSPEQAMGKTMDSRCDIYALGCVMYETLSGKPPFRGSNILDTLTQHINDDPPPLTSAPASMQVIVKKAMEKNPKDRYQTMTEFKRDLDAIAEGNQSKLTSTYKLLVKPKVRRWVVPVVALVAGLVGLTIWGAVEIAPSPRFEHRVATSWMWAPEPAGFSAPPAAPPTSTESSTDATPSAAPPVAAGDNMVRNMGDVLDSDKKDRPTLVSKVVAADNLYQKTEPTKSDFENAAKYYLWCSQNWAEINGPIATTADPNAAVSTDWDLGHVESRLADCLMYLGRVEEAVPHYDIANKAFLRCQERVKGNATLAHSADANVAMSALDLSYAKSKLKQDTESPSKTWERLSTAFAGNKYLGIVRQDLSNVQWNIGSMMDAEASRVQAAMDRVDGTKQPYTSLPISKP